MLRDGFEVLIDGVKMPQRAARFMASISAARPDDADVTTAYEGKRHALMLYGPGAVWRLSTIATHLAAGGRVLMWDLGYWDRESSMRLSIDRQHPTANHLACAPDGARREFVLREDYDSRGPVMLVGMGRKSVAAWYAGQEFTWERKALKRIRSRYPARDIVWRPKGTDAVPFAGLPMRHGMSVQEALKGCSLVVCRHSNVAVDACVAGVPVECEDGAAHALYSAHPRPSREDRAEFLRRLSWFEWSCADAAGAWDFCRHLLASTKADTSGPMA